MIEKVKLKNRSADDYDQREQEDDSNPGDKAAAHIMAMQNEARIREEEEEKEQA